jgi:membrane associated rhomboid family serine protease
MIPLHDDVPTTRPPIVTVGLIIACALTFLWQQTLPEREQIEIVYQLGSIPAELLGHGQVIPPEYRLVEPWLAIFTSMFLHGGWLHLIGNMLYLWIFGNNVEDSMGHLRFIVFYLLSGVAAALAQSWHDPVSETPMVGASGAIAGVLGGYLLIHPRARVLVLVPLGIFSQVMRIPAWLVLSLWFVIQFVFSAAQPTGEGGVAYWAHICGFAAGVVLILPFKRREVPLFGGPAGGPWGARR